MGRTRSRRRLSRSRGVGRATIRQTAIFDPAGLAGLAYWHALYPVHSLIFGGMLRALATRAEAEPV